MSEDKKIIPFYEGDEGSNDDRPLPLYVAEQWGFDLQHYDMPDGVWYAAQDWIAGLATTNTRRAGKLWADMQKQMSVSIVPLDYLASDGKNYQRDFTDDEGLYKIAAYMRATKGRIALKGIKDFLAQAGAFADLARRDPESASGKLAAQRQKKYMRAGKEEEWIALREIGRVTRNQLMALIKHLLAGKADDGIYRTITDDTYRGVFGMSAAEMRVHMGLPAGTNVRDHMHILGLLYTRES